MVRGECGTGLTWADDEEPRVIARDNTVTFKRLVLQVANQRGRRSCAGLAVLVCLTSTGPIPSGEHMWVTWEQSARGPQPIPDHLATESGTCGGLALAASVVRYELTKAPEGGTNLRLIHDVPMNQRLIPASLTRAARGTRTVTESAPPDMVQAAWEIHLELLDAALRNPGNRAMSLRSGEQGW